MNENKLWTFIWRIAATHTIAYFIAGIFALYVLRYDEIFSFGSLSFMRPIDSPWIAAGPGLQIIRGFLLAFFLFPFRTIFLKTKKGWIKFWFLTFGLSYLLTISPAIGSYEGLLYTTIPIKYHLIGIPEVVLYITVFTTLMWAWYKKPKPMFNYIFFAIILLIEFMSLLGVLASFGIIDAS